MAGKSRSPNYPALALTQTLELAQRLWDAEKRTAVANGDAALAMGFKSLSGPARVAIGALRQYGLIDKAEKGHVQLSDLAVRALHGDQVEQMKAVSEAATTPPLFQELVGSHADASENAVRSYLITKKGFVEDGARKAAKAFREAMSLVITPKPGYNQSSSTEKTENMRGNEADHGQGDDGSKPPDGLFSLTVPFSKGTIAVQVRVTGDAISPAHLARVRKYLELAESEWDGEDH